MQTNQSRKALVSSSAPYFHSGWMSSDNSEAPLRTCVAWAVQLNSVQFVSVLVCQSFKAATQHLSCCVYRGATSQGRSVKSICPVLRSGLLQSAASASIEKAEPRWPIQPPPRALIQLKMNSLNLWRGELQSWSRAKWDPATRARLNLLNMKPNLGNNLVSAGNWVCFPQQMESQFIDLPVL